MTIEAEIKRYRNLANNERCCQKEECMILANWLEEFLKYRKAEEQGLLLRLPCKVGDTVYIVVGKDISPQTITGILISTRVGMEFTTRKRVFNETSIGETVFLTREEAKSALREKGGVE